MTMNRSARIPVILPSDCTASIFKGGRGGLPASHEGVSHQAQWSPVDIAALLRDQAREVGVERWVLPLRRKVEQSAVDRQLGATLGEPQCAVAGLGGDFPNRRTL